MLSEGLTDEARYALDVRLGIVDPDQPVEYDEDPRLAEEVPVAREDPAAMAAIAAFGEATYE